jgi:hypothetical protein
MTLGPHLYIYQEAGSWVRSQRSEVSVQKSELRKQTPTTLGELVQDFAMAA